MMQLSEVAARVQRAATPLATALTYRTINSYSVKAAANAAIGATVVSLGTLGTVDRVLAGDILTMGTQSRTVAADTLAVAGVINAPITAALTTAVASASTVTIQRTTDTPCLGFVDWLDTSTTIVPGIVSKDGRITVLADSLSVTPKINQYVIVEGLQRFIKNVGRDVAGGVWSILVSG